MSALRRTTLGLLAAHIAATDTEDATGAEAMEYRVLGAVASICGTREAHPDVRFTGLDIIHNVLQVCVRPLERDTRPVAELCFLLCEPLL